LTGPIGNIILKKIIQSLGNAIIKYPTSFGAWISVLQLMVYGINEIVIAGNDAFENIFPILHQYIPNKIFQSTSNHLLTVGGIFAAILPSFSFFVFIRYISEKNYFTKVSL